METAPPKRKSRRRARIERFLLGALLGGLAGYLCTFLPPEYQHICKVGAKLAGLLTGGE